MKGRVNTLRDLNEKILKQNAAFKNLESWPADAPLAVLGLSWNGVGHLVGNTHGTLQNPRAFREACQAEDFNLDSLHCQMINAIQGDKASIYRRSMAQKSLLLNAAIVPASLALGSRRLAGFRRRLSRGAWLFPSPRRGLFRFGRGFSHRWQFALGLFRSAMMAMVQRLNARGFLFHPQPSVAILLALVFQVCRNRFRCHGQSVAEPAHARLSTLALYRLKRSQPEQTPDLRYDGAPQVLFCPLRGLRMRSRS
jgi:hypothetical protein